MRGPLPLNDHDFANIRAQVMAKIETPRRAPVWRYAFATMALAVMVFSIYIGRQPMVAPPPGKPPVLVATAAPGVRASRPHPVAVPAAGIVEKPQRRGTRRWSGRDARTPPPPQKVARIELQTADPDVRIIWITN